MDNKAAVERALGKVLIPGASSGIGALHGERLAHRGGDLILVDRMNERLESLAARLVADTGRAVEIIVAGLNEKSNLARVEQRLRADEEISFLPMNPSRGATTPLVNSNIDKVQEMIGLNVTAVVRLTYATVPEYLKRSAGTIVNIASIVGIAPEFLNGV